MVTFLKPVLGIPMERRSFLAAAAGLIVSACSGLPLFGRSQDRPSGWHKHRLVTTMPVPCYDVHFGVFDVHDPGERKEYERVVANETVQYLYRHCCGQGVHYVEWHTRSHDDGHYHAD
jgi:hypothetical protein